jgi:hypothetical protein
MKRFAHYSEKQRAEQVFESLKGGQKEVVRDNHPAILAVQEYFSQFLGKPTWRATAADVAEFARLHGISTFKAPGMGRRINEIRSELEAIYRMTTETPRGGSTVYVFHRPAVDDGGDVQQIDLHASSP